MVEENHQDKYPSEPEQIMLTGFYLYEEKGVLYMGAMTPVGLMAFPLDPLAWIDWLREQLARCRTSDLPSSIKEEFSNYV